MKLNLLARICILFGGIITSLIGLSLLIVPGFASAECLILIIGIITSFIGVSGKFIK